jgi:uncharacterized protein YqkB
MSLSVVVKPNADFSSGNITRALLNQAAKPTVAVAGSIGTEEIEALSITEAKIADGTLGNSKLQDTTITYKKLAALGRGNVLVGEAKSEDDNIDGGDTVRLKLPENGFLVGDGNDVKAMVFDNSSSGAISMSQYTDSSTGDTSFSLGLVSAGVRSSHIAARAISISKLSPNGGTAVTDAATYSTLPIYDGSSKTSDNKHYGTPTLLSSEPTVVGLATTGLMLKSSGVAGPLSFGGLASKTIEATANIAFGVSGTAHEYTFTQAHLFVDKEGDGITPSFVRCVLRCTDDNQGYAIDDEVDAGSVAGGYIQDYGSVFWSNKTHVGFVLNDESDVLRLPHKTDPNTTFNADETKWRVKFYISP